MLGRLHHVVLDCPDPAALAAFYSQLLGQPITYQSDDWVVVAGNDTSSGLAFQLAPDHPAPTWPDPAVPQQFHLDVMVEDVTSAEPRVLALGARKLRACLAHRVLARLSSATRQHEHTAPVAEHARALLALAN